MIYVIVDECMDCRGLRYVGLRWSLLLIGHLSLSDTGRLCSCERTLKKNIPCVTKRLEYVLNIHASF